jgi:hypothetical protein
VQVLCSGHLPVFRDEATDPDGPMPVQRACERSARFFDMANRIEHHVLRSAQGTLMTPFMCKALDAYLDSFDPTISPTHIEMTMVQYQCLLHEVTFMMPYVIHLEHVGTPTYRGVPIEIKP